MTNPSSPDLKSLWQSQETETDPMTLEQIHALVGKYDRKTRTAAVGLAVVLLVSGFLAGQAWLIRSDPLGRTGAVLYLLGMMGACALIARMNFPKRDPAESAADFLRRRLKRQLATVRGGWVLILLPIAPAIAVVGFWIYEHNRGATWERFLPVLGLAAMWLIFMIARTRRAAPKLKADLDELDRLMQ